MFTFISLSADGRISDATRLVVRLAADARALRRRRNNRSGSGLSLSESGAPAANHQKDANPSLSGMSCDAHSGSHTFSANTLRIQQKESRFDDD